ncbi:hypothetical protein AKUH4B202J_01120 [Apilactobacillus kunkeei]|nr:hypothetical protein AKUH4B202J_01120 [Apilactobacillus kunkeei]
MNKNRNNSFRLAVAHSKYISKKSRYKLQFMALKKFFFYPTTKKLNLNRHNKSYFLGRFRTVHFDDSHLYRDLSFKNDFMTPRQSVLFSPRGYIYFTTQVFELVRKLVNLDENFIDEKSNLNFSTRYVKVYYAGYLNFKNKNIENCATYNYSYNKFKNEISRFKNNKVLKIDIQDFFLGITIKRLDDILTSLMKHYHSTCFSKEKLNIIDFLNHSGYMTLPQSQGSLACSILSQIYLIEMTNCLNELCKKYDVEMVRYVDDMFIKIPDSLPSKKINELINSISTLLWRYGLSLNSKKIKLFGASEFIEEVQYSPDVSFSPRNFVQQKYIDDKIDDLLKNDGEKLLDFVERVSQLFIDNGNDMSKYHQIVHETFSINEDNENKVQNALIYGDRWHALSNEKKKEFLKSKNLCLLTFDPDKYVPFVLKLQTNLCAYGIVDKYIIKEFFINESYSVRDGLIKSKYYVQLEESKRKIPSLISENIINTSKKYNYFKDYYLFILKFIIKND